MENKVYALKYRFYEREDIVYPDLVPMFLSTSIEDVEERFNKWRETWINRIGTINVEIIKDEPNCLEIRSNNSYYEYHISSYKLNEDLL